jgi:hypothetical protein
MTIYNRKNKMNYDSLGRPIAKPVFFTQPKINSDEEEKIEGINKAVKEFSKKLPATLSEEERAKLCNQHADFLNCNWSLVKKYQNPDERKQMSIDFQAALAEIVQSKGKNISLLLKLNNQFKIPQKYEVPSVFGHFLKTTLGLGISTYSPMLYLGLGLASQIIPAAAQTAGAFYQAFGDTPVGGKDLCGGASYCIQGYIENANGTTVTQFNRINQQLNTMNLGALWQMSRCINFDLVSKIVIDTLEGTPVNGTESVMSSCIGYSDTLYGYQASSEMTNITPDMCNAFKNNFAAGTSTCISVGDAIGLNIAITVMILATLGTCVGICIGGFCLLKDSDCEPPCLN